MAWIRTVGEDEAEGDLERQYQAAVRRAGKVFHVVRLSSLNPEVNRVFLDLYVRLMHGPSDLSRRQREMLATVVSRANSCHY
jgi:alkylhydroperoxidase family enzyme